MHRAILGAIIFATLSLASMEAAAQSAAASQYREYVLGEANAPVSIIEYASLTCHFCAQFHQTVYPDLKKNYIDTGKVRFVFRDYPLDGLATAAAVIARCAPGDRGLKLVEMLFKNQDAWMRSEKPIEPIKGYAQLAGMSSADVDACLKNEAIITSIRDVQNTGTTLYKIDATPTFYINGDKVSGNPGYEVMAKMIESKMKEKK